MIGQIVVSMSEVINMRDQLQHIVEDKLVKKNQAQIMLDAARERALLVMSLYYEDDPFVQDELTMKFSLYAVKFIQAREKLYMMGLSPEEREVLDMSVLNAAQTSRSLELILQMILERTESGAKTGYQETFEILKKEAIPARESIAKNLRKLHTLIDKEAERAIVSATLSFQRTKMMLLMLGVAFFALSILIARFVYLRISITTNKLHFMYKELDKVASYDDLTGLLNRRSFLEKLESIVATSQGTQEKFMVIFLDLDEFKPINDNYGHAAGDLVLQKVAYRLLKNVREKDFIARLGGDEFVVVGYGDGEELAERLLESIQMPIQLPRVEVKLGVSIGVSVYPKNGVDQESLLNAADSAMYLAKESGKSKIVFSE